jgi:hypothetical protein
VPPLRPPVCTPAAAASGAGSPPASTPPVHIPGVTGSASAPQSSQQGSGRSQQLLDYLLKP